MKKAEGCVGGKVKRGDARRGADVSKDVPAFAMKAETAEAQGGADGQADANAAPLVNPVVVKGVFEEEGGGEDEYDDRQPANPIADPPLDAAGARPPRTLLGKPQRRLRDQRRYRLGRA